MLPDAPLRLLLVEDDLAYSQMLKEMLERQVRVSWSTTITDSLARAKKMLAEEDWDLVLLDLNLPDSVGLDTLLDVLRLVAEVALVVVTGEGDEEMGRMALKAGAQDYLIKPDITPAILTRSLLYALERKRGELAHLQTQRDLEELVRARTEELERTNRALSRQIEEKREAEARHLHMLEALPDPVAVYDDKGRATYVNQAFEETYGYTRAEALAGKVRFVPQGEVDKLAQGLKELWGQGKANLETRRLTKDGRLLDVSIRTAALRRPDGEFMETLAIHRDVTARKRVERELQRSEALYRNIVDAANEGIWITDESYRTSFANAKMADLLGCAQVELMDASVMDYALPERREDLRRALDSRRKGSYEFPWRRGDGSVFWTLTSTAPLFDAQGQYLGALGMIADISGRKEMEDRLRSSEERLRHMAENINDTLWQTDADLKMTYVSPSVTRRLGITAEQLVGQGALSTLTPESQEEARAVLARLMIPGEASSATLIVRQMAENGALLYSEVKATVMRDDQGRFAGLVGVTRDVTARVRAEEALNRVSRTLRAIQECHRAMSRAVSEDEMMREVCRIICQDAGHCLAWVGMVNPEMGGDLTAVAKWGDEEGLLDPVSIPLEQESEFGRSPMAAAVIEKQPQVVSDMAMHHYNPPWRDEVLRRGLNSALSLPLLHEGEVLGVMGIMSSRVNAFTDEEIELLQQLTEDLAQGIGMLRGRDERRAAKAALVESERKYRQLHESLAEGYAMVDLQGRFLECNTAFEALVGYAWDELEGTEFNRLTPSAWHEMEARILSEQVLSQGFSQVYEKEYRRKDGVIVPVELRAFLLRDENGQPRAMWAIVREISKRKQWEEELTQAKERAVMATMTKSRFLATMSHEIRTPMNGVLGMLELALDTELNDEQREFLSTAKSSAGILLGLINDILDLSKIEAGRMELEEVEFSLRDSLGDAMRSLAPAAHAKGLELNFGIAPQAPDVLMGDPGRLRQIVINLVGNAIKFTEKGEVTLDVDVTGQDAQGVDLIVAVRDTGIGIPAHVQDYIFDTFTQADGSVTRHFGGTGLGLSISRQLSQMMGGRMWVESEPGKGSTFSFTARLAKGEGPLLRSAPARDEQLRGVRVLVVDDNSTNRRILCRMLEDKGTLPVPAEGGRQALALLGRAGSSFGLALIDVNMPEMDGFELAELLRSSGAWADLPLVMLTSAGQRGDAARCRSLGVAGYLIKPISERELWQTLLAVWGESRATSIKPPLVTRHYLRERGKSLNILLAEDNKVNQKVATAMLGKRGHRVVVADDGQAAVDLWGTGGFDLVLMDVEMPVMDGLTATKMIRDKEKEGFGRLPIIGLTAHAMAGDRERFMAAGMDDVLAKPMDLAAMDTMLAKVQSSDEPFDPLAR